MTPKTVAAESYETPFAPPARPEDLTAEARAAIEAEVTIFETVRASLLAQLEEARARLQRTSIRSRELTSQLVAAQTDDDRALLASDETVSHTLATKIHGDIALLEKIIERPYFARLVVEEQHKGQSVSREYRLGFAANPDTRILDWRRAPVAKLYYEYAEGDHYSEEIQGQEREGLIRHKSGVTITNGEIREVSCRLGRFFLQDGSWVPLARHSSTASSHLPDVLSLVTREQFQAITIDAEKAVFIQGVAGSGKTTVALYRLAWVLSGGGIDPDDRESEVPEAARCLVLVSQRPLRSYIRQSLQPLKIPDVEVLTYREWAQRIIVRGAPHLCEEQAIRRPKDLPAPGAAAVLESPVLVQALEQVVRELQLALKPGRTVDDLRNESLALTLSEAPAGCPQRETETARTWIEKPESVILATLRAFLDGHHKGAFQQEALKAAAARAAALLSQGRLDQNLDALLARAVQLTRGERGLKDAARSREPLDHLVADEVQDLSPAGLAALLGAVRSPSDLTLVGDMQQRIEEVEFALWERLRNDLGLADDEARFVTLEVSHRSTLPILRLANAVGRRQSPELGREGRVPILFRSHRESKALEALLGWLGQAVERYPSAITAVLALDRHEARHILSLLRPTFGSAVRLGDGDDFTFTEGIVVADIRQVKGLEFANVALWNVNAKRFPATDTVRRMLYVAITRAQDNLCLVSAGRPSALLPGTQSRLLRVVEIENEDEE